MLEAIRFSEATFFEACKWTVREDPKDGNKLEKVLHQDRERAVDRGKYQLAMVFQHLQKLNAEAIVVEYRYVDQDFLNDHASFYVACFPEYEKDCSRLHFFRDGIVADEFTRFIAGDNPKLDDRMKRSYLGFIVLKPLQEAIVGRTCLAPYPDLPKGEFKTKDEEEVKDPNLHFPFCRDYESHVAGLDLKVKTLAFQEQDTAAAACATIALWSSLHRRIFNNDAPSPGKITELAGDRNHLRTLPSKGLGNEQMTYAMKRLGLDVELIGGVFPQDPYLPFEALYAYGRFGIPCILGLSLYEKGAAEKPASPFYEKGLDGIAPHYANRHAITLTGLELGEQRPRQHDEDKAPLVADRLKAIYAHDDQVGPFTRMPVATWAEDDSSMPPRLSDELRTALDKNPPFAAANLMGGTRVWTVCDMQFKDGYPPIGVLDAILVPLARGIRLSYESARKSLDDFHGILKTVGLWSPALLFEWDLRLSSVNELRRDVANWIVDSSLSGARHRGLESNWPLYLWRGTLYDNRGKPILEVVMDASDIHRSFFVLDILPIDPRITPLLTEIASAAAFSQLPTKLVQGQFRGEPDDASRFVRDLPDWKKILAKTLSGLVRQSDLRSLVLKSGEKA